MSEIVRFEDFGNLTKILGQEFLDGTREPLQCTLIPDEFEGTPPVTFELLAEMPRCFVCPKLRATAPVDENGNYLDIVYDFRVTVELANGRSKSNEWYSVDSRFFDSEELQEFLGFEISEQDKKDIIKALEVREFYSIESLKSQIQKLQEEIKMLEERNNE